ncbi:MAG: hypothetical protein WD208_02020 [Dehalococcoidia bacterium]
MANASQRWLAPQARLARRMGAGALAAPARPRLRWGFRLCLALMALPVFFVPVGDRVHMSPAQEESTGHHYQLVSWMVSNFMDKWWHRVYTAAPWTDTSEERRRAELDRYVELAGELRAARSAVTDAASAAIADPGLVVDRQADLDRLLAERDSIRNGVEEYLESVVSEVLVRYELNARGSFIWPPVDFRLDNPPSVLVISPRDRISRTQTVLIDPDISVTDMERIERSLLTDHDLSAAVMRTGGLASYPTVVPSDRGLLPLLEVVAHEWLHAYLIFHRLGQAYWSSGEMLAVNETLADMAGREIGREAYTMITGEFVPPVEAPRDVAPPEPPPPGQFDFFRFMRETRERTDELLEMSEVTEAEAYMESRRVELLDHGYVIRRLNQAYFAFHGSYGESPSSASPIAGQMWEVRQNSSDVGDFVKAMQPISTYSEFKELVANAGSR